MGPPRHLERDLSSTDRTLSIATGARLAVLITFSPGLFMLLVSAGCSGLSKRVHQDDVVLARQIARQGADAFHEKDWERAEQYYSKAVEVCPVDERVRARYAETMWNLGLHREAIEHQEHAVRLSGSDPDLVIRLGEMYLAEGELVVANRLAQRVIDSGRESASAYRLRGDVLVRQGLWREALAAYQHALSFQPSAKEVQLSVAQVYQCHGRPQRALATLQSLLAAYPPGEAPAELHYWQGMAFASLHRYSQAVRHFSTAGTRGLESADLQFRLAEAQFQLGDRSAAQSALRRGMELDPNHPQAARLCEVIEGGHRVARVPD